MSLSIWIPQKKHNLLISKRIIIILQYDNTLLNEIPVNKYTDKSSAEIKNDYCRCEMSKLSVNMLNACQSFHLPVTSRQSWAVIGRES